VQLDRAEATATRIAYRAGFRHYIAEHDVRPSLSFIDFVAHAP
jgi:hypothetical protein